MCQRNIEVCSCNHCCSGKAMSITYSECVCVALVIQHTMHMHYIVICSVFDSTIFFYVISWTTQFLKKLTEPFPCPNRYGLHYLPHLVFPLQFPELVIKWFSFPPVFSFSSPSPYFVLLSMPLTGFTHNSTHPTSPPCLLLHFNSLPILFFPDII